MVAHGRPRGTHAGRDDKRIGTQERAHLGRLLRRAHDAVGTCVNGKLGQARHLLGNGALNANGGKCLGVHAREDRDRHEARTLSPALCRGPLDARTTLGDHRRAA